MTFQKKWNIKNKRLYNCWHGMRGRCFGDRKDSKYYKEKGITICDEWVDDYESFQEWALKNGYKDNLTLDRIDGTKGYCPNNCRWITIAEQQRNKSNCIFINYNGKKRLLSDVAKETGINRTTLHDRIFKFGYSVEEAVLKDKNHPRNTVYINYNGKKYSQGEFSKKLNVTVQAISQWKKSGMTPEQMVKRASNIKR